jgi:hypothetical protein
MIPDSVVLNLKTLYFPKVSLHAYDVHRKLVLDGNSAKYAYNNASVSLNFRFQITESDILFQKALAADATHS